MDESSVTIDAPPERVFGNPPAHAPGAVGLRSDRPATGARFVGSNRNGWVR